jgi:DNA-directed RNA polymerase subunit RPC12/RpoP
MSGVFRCTDCKHDLFEDLGVFRFADNNFRGLKCLKCGKNIFLEMKSNKYKVISSEFEEKSVLKLMIK